MQGVAPGREQNWTAGGATTSGQMTKQEGEGPPTQTRTGAGGCTPQTTHQARTPRQEPSIATSCPKGDDSPRGQQGSSRNGTRRAVAVPRGMTAQVGSRSRGGTGQGKPWQPQQRYDRKETPQPTLALAGSDPEHGRKRSSRRRVIASKPPTPEMTGH